MVGWDSKLRQVLREQCKKSLDYWEKFETFEKFARVELTKVEFECQHYGFTLHGVEHAEGVEEKLERLIPPELLVNDYDPRDNHALAPEELFLLLLATWSHDFGMIDPKQRQIHNCRSRDCIWDSEKKQSKVLWCHLESNFAYYVGQLCYAHRDHQEDGTRVDTLSMVEEGDNLGKKGNRIRPRLLAALLRLADELDIGADRAPEDVMYVTNLSEDSAKYWLSEDLINTVEIDSAKLRISLVPFKVKVKGNPLYEKIVDARCLKIQEELDRMGDVLRKSLFDYREVHLDGEPIRSIMMRNLVDYQGGCIERYKDAVREMASQVEEYDKKFENLVPIARQLEEITGSFQHLVIRSVAPTGSSEASEVMSALVVAFDSGWRNRLVSAVQPSFKEVVQADNVAKAYEAINTQEFAVIVTELNLDTECAGLMVLKAAREVSRERGSHTQVIVLAPQGQPGISAEAMVNGAYDYLEYTDLEYSFHSAAIIKRMEAKVSKAIEFRAQTRKEV